MKIIKKKDEYKQISSAFLNKLEKFNMQEDFILIYDEVLNRIGVAVCFLPTFVNFLYFSNDF